MCNHRLRANVERDILQSYSYASIVRYLDAAHPGHGLGVDAVRRHLAHIPLQESVGRVIAEERAEELARNVEEFEGALADHVSFLRLGVQRAYERLATGEIEPTIAEAAAMARILAQLEAQAGPVIDQADILRGFLAYMRATEEVLAIVAPGRSREGINLLGKRLRADPVMRSLLDQEQGG